MTLGNKIIKERNKKGWSQEELADKLGVSGQTVSEWESSRSVPDLQSVILMAELFGVSTDYLLREDPFPEETSAAYTDESVEKAETVRRVSMEEANEFLDMKRKGASIVANAVSMCITSPVPVVVLGVLAKSGIINIKETLAGAAWGRCSCSAWSRLPWSCSSPTGFGKAAWSTLKKRALKRNTALSEW